jgi:cyclophilin family peptidyl-prolyl cis-trans isomerase
MWTLMIVGLLAGQTTRPAVQPSTPLGHLRAEIRTERTTVNAGSPVWTEFVIRNLGAKPVQLVVPGTEVPANGNGPAVMGLPIEHVFSGVSWRALSIADRARKNLGDLVRRPPVGPVDPVRLAGQSSVGIRVDLGQFYPALREPGEYRCQWRPYDGLLKSNEVTVRVAVLEQVVVRTGFGDMTIQLLYDKAPRHVANFLELARQGFYNGLTFHRVVGGALIQGGDPAGDGSGNRPDGKTLKPEINDTPFELGTVGMATSPGDPNSGSCQFFVCLRRIASLDGKYTAFGRITDQRCLTVLQQIGMVPTDQYDRPVQTVRMNSVTVQPVPARQEER